MPDRSLSPHVRVGEYVLGLLDPQESAALERELRTDVALQADCTFWITRLATLNVTYGPVPCPVEYAAIATRLFGKPAVRTMPLWLKLGAVVAVMVIIVVKIALILRILAYLGL